MRRLPCALVLLGTLACTDGTSPDIHAHSPDLATLGVGRVRTLTFAEAQNGLTIPESMSEADYLVVVSNINTASFSTPEYVIRGDLGAAFESRLRQSERRTLGAPDVRKARGPALRKQRIGGGGGRAAILPPAVGDPMSIKVYKEGLNPVDCLSYVNTTGTVRAVSNRAIIVSDTRTPAGGFTVSDYQAIANEFDAITYPTGVGYFGEPSDIDDNERVIIYYTPTVNEMTPAGDAATKGYIGGFFFAGDLYDAETPLPFGCPASNESEIFYLLAPDPNTVFGNRFQLDLVRSITRGTVAHEFQHMINSGHRIFTTDAPFEAGWLDEALAHFAEDVTGRVALNIGDLVSINATRMSQMSEADQDAFFVQNFFRARYFLERPDTSAPIAREPKGTDLPSRGASWAMLRYVADWFSGNSPRTLTRALAMGPDTGVANLVKNARVPLDTILSRWLVTLYTDHSGQAGLPAQYNYRSYDFRSIISALRAQMIYPLPTRTLGSGIAVISSKVPPSSAAYFLVNQDRNTTRTIRVTDEGGTSSIDSNGRLYIVRLR